MSFFRTPMDPEVQQELFRRIDGLNKAEPYTLNGKDVSDILGPKSEALENEYFKTCWARVITIDGTGNPYYLNSQLGKDGKTPITEPLNIKNNGDYSRGRAGITSISSNYKEFFLKQSTISFLCPDPKEFEEINERFLKHGRYVLVEFGWSTRKNIQLEKITTNNLVKFSNNLSQRTKNSRGNYAAICGVITNFNFNQKQDGSYEGTFEVSSMGRNILGQKIKTDGKIENLVNFVNEKIEEDKKVDNPDTPEQETNLTDGEIESLKSFRSAFVNFHATIKALPDVIEAYVNSKVHSPSTETKLEVISNAYSSKEHTVIKSKNGAAYIPVTSNFGFKTPEDSKANLAYCTWGWFEDYILNSFFAFTSKSGNEEFKTRFFSTDDKEFDREGNVVRNESTKCKSNKNLFSLGLQSIILPGKFKQFEPNTETENMGLGENPEDLIERDTPAETIYGGLYDAAEELTKSLFTNNSTGAREKAMVKIIEHFATNFESFEDQGKQQGNIRNMVFEANYLIDSFTDAINIDHALMNFWQKVSNDYGGFWRFGVVEDDNSDGRIKIKDLNIGEIDDSKILEKNKLSTRNEYINWDSNKEDPGKIFKFPLYDKNSFVQDFSIETAYDSEMATMAVFGSNADMQATRGDMGQGYTELAVRALSLIQNKTLKSKTKSEQEREDFYDDILKNLQVPVNTNIFQQGGSSTHNNNLVKQSSKGGIAFKLIDEIQNNLKQIMEDINEVNSQPMYTESEIRKGYFWFDITDTITQIYSSRTGQILNEFKRTMLYLINKSADKDDASNYNVVLPAVPLQLGLTIQGIGGIKIGDLFYVDYLPQMYREFCHWMIVSVEHEISTTGWTTKLDSRMIVDIPKLVEKYKDDLTKTEFKPFEVPPGKQLRDEIQRLKQKAGEQFLEDNPDYVPDYLNEETQAGRMYSTRTGRFR